MYLASTRNWHIQLRLTLLPFAAERVQAAIAGRERLEASENSAPTPVARRAVTMADLLHVKEALLSSVSTSAADRLTLWAAVTLGFFGFLRGSEYLSPARHHFHRQRTLQLRHLTVHRNRLVVRIPASKTDQLGEGTSVIIDSTGTSVCAVAAMQAHLLSQHRAPDEPIFAYTDGNLLTAADLNRRLKEWCGAGTSTHSLRIGATTAAARAGLPTWQLPACGRWRSDAYLRYIRKEAGAFDGVARRVAGH